MLTAPISQVAQVAQVAQSSRAGHVGLIDLNNLIVQVAQTETDIRCAKFAVLRPAIQIYAEMLTPATTTPITTAITGPMDAVQAMMVLAAIRVHTIRVHTIRVHTIRGRGLGCVVAWTVVQAASTGQTEVPTAEKGP
jgi:hypothetical protein